MKLIRIIPTLLVSNNLLVKGEKFKDHSYVGDVYNAVKIFSEKKAHEIILIDILARKKNDIFDIELIKKIKNEIFIPLTIGGGINTLEQASRIIDQGVEKISLNSALNEDPKIVEKIANKFGSQSVVVSIDVRKIDNKYKIFFQNGEVMSNLPLVTYLQDLENLGAGEILLTSIDNEGKKIGFDLELYKMLENKVNLPIIANGGASNLASFEGLFDKTEISAASAGASFVYYGSRKAVLINYPDSASMQKIMDKYERWK